MLSIRLGLLVLASLAVLGRAQNQHPRLFVQPAQTFKTLASFHGPDGVRPFDSLVQGSDGNFYGTTYEGGVGSNCNLTDGCGVVFKVTPRGKLTTLYDFCAQPNCADGGNPLGALVQSTDGNLYGTTFGADSNNGTVFKVTPQGKLTTLYTFCAQGPPCPDGADPIAGLVRAADGNFYGTTQSGGTTFAGTVFRITPHRKLTTLHGFRNRGDGLQPMGVLVQATDGNLYGTTSNGGGSSNCYNYNENYCGTVFKITPNGKLTTLYNFCRRVNCADGASPWAGVIQASDGNFYGTTSEGGTTNNGGTVFKLTPGGTLTTLHRFCAQANCPDGYDPVAALIQATDGNLYGTTLGGGVKGGGTVFKITPKGKLTTLHSFDPTSGSASDAGLFQATDGCLYGTTEIGGNVNCDQSFGCGTVFKLSVGLVPLPKHAPLPVE